ncbi:Gcn5-related N-acetyltransferase (GNAT) domain protein [Acididesulfobacillus acetoxydans]|uniref:Gcn5-related N-acetyltransferase (GNAT) domain protein n=1 Tax=Acididesulfobacillus acetoxydans TaxID=1561005 RepID=A0A8S0XCD8_9FIRM|nr:GNAT family N-acetyltransferase [Acididesulfobacillus acetoxydans]CAA7602326.1 Gcn5-related N-acetyltransferase (GNAT) domain protein [Acididesulfobacillus acetoxydans]CEJ08439.1 Sortase-like acyltransferase [Acididesulfobacillus acetoxydans]
MASQLGVEGLGIRQALRADLGDVLGLYRQLDLNRNEVLPLEQAERILAKMELYPDYKVYVAEINSDIVGTFALAVMDNLAHAGKPSGLLEDVVVGTGYRGKGIGRLMMEYALSYCRKQGCYKVALSSNLAREGAHAFYERLGFRKHGYSFLVELG